MNKNYIISSSITLLGIFFAFALFSFELKRFQTLPLIGTYVFLFLLIWIWVKKYSSIGNIFFLGIICRLIFWNYIPNLSQDFYRFIWDGSIQLFGGAVLLATINSTGTFSGYFKTIIYSG